MPISLTTVGVGLGSELALNGAVAHAFADILFKALLFMSMGAVLPRVGTAKGSELGGLYKSMPWTTGFCIVGAASISAFPLFSGFVTKSMVIAAAMDKGYFSTWLVLLFASAGVFHHAGIEFPYFAFFAHNSGKRCEEAPGHMLIAMAVAAVLCVGIGSFPALLYAILPFQTNFHPYSLDHVVGQVQLLFLSALAFTLLMRTGIYPPELRSTNLDFDWFYRRLGSALALAVGRRAVAAWDCATAATSRVARYVLLSAERYLGRVAFWPAPGRPAAWRFGPASCWPPTTRSTRRGPRERSTGDDVQLDRSIVSQRIMMQAIDAFWRRAGRIADEVSGIAERVRKEGWLNHAAQARAQPPECAIDITVVLPVEVL